MPRHVDLTANVERTNEELVRIMYSFDEIDTVVAGYPELNNRYYVPEGVEIPFQRDELLGREVRIFQIEPGYDATQSPMRAATLKNMRPEEFLYGAPDPDRPTGGAWSLPENHPTVGRAISENCRDFTPHLQPLVPGWRQLLALQTPDGEPLGMPTGIGWYTHYWLSKMCDGVSMRLSKDQTDLEVLLYKRRADNQSESVWATPGGYVIAADTGQRGVTPLQAASARRTQYWASRDVSRYSGVPLNVKYPISSGNTLVAGLETTPYGRFIHDPDYQAEPRVRPRLRRQAGAAGFVSMRALCEFNPTGGTSGKPRADNPFPIWTTHFEYVAAQLSALINSENQYRFGMSDAQFEQVQNVVEALEARYPALQP